MSEIKLGEGELSDVFETSAPKQEVQETPQPEIEADKGEKDVEPPSTEDQPASEPEAEPEKENAQVPREALIAERKKRQELEDRLSKLETAATPKVETKAEKKQRTDVFTDPDKALDEVEQSAEVKAQLRIYNYGKRQLTKSNPDFPEMEQTFIKLAESNPKLAADFANSDDPAEFVLETARKHLAVDEITKDPAAFEERIRQKILAELQGQAPAPKAKAKLPPSLATANGVKDVQDQVSQDLRDYFPSTF